MQLHLPALRFSGRSERRETQAVSCRLRMLDYYDRASLAPKRLGGLEERPPDACEGARWETSRSIAMQEGDRDLQ